MEEYPRSKASLTIKYLLDNQSVSTLAVGFRTSDQLSEILSAYNEQLELETFPQLIAEILVPAKYEQHR